MKSVPALLLRPALVLVALLVFALFPLPAAFSQDANNPDPVYNIVEWGKGYIVEGEVLVQFKAAQPDMARTSIHDAMGTRKVREIAEGLDLVRFDKGDVDVILDEYNRNPAVEFAEPNIIFFANKTTPNDSYFSQQWGPIKIRCEYAWDTYKGNSSHLCAMIDSGLDKNHGDFLGQVAGGYDYYAMDGDWDDTDGHGTHVAGTVGAKNNNAKGVAGVSWNCRLLIYRAGNATLPTSAIVSSINAAKNNGALALSMSFGSYQPSSSISSALTSANDAGVVCVAAAGNDSSTSLHYPAAHAPVIAVASSNASDNRSSFSNYGSWVEVAAPGENILSTWDGNQYAWADGTSMACPHVAGMAVLLYSKLGGTRSKANADAVRAAIENSCVSKTWVQFGRVDLDAAMDLVAPPAVPSLSSVSPTSYKAFQGGTMTLNGTSLSSVTQVTAAGKSITGVDITVVSDTQIKVQAPTSPGNMGPYPVYVTNSSGTSNSVYFTYVETNPPKLSCPVWVSSGASFSWEFGGGANDIYYILFAGSSATFPYKGYNILLNYVPIYFANANAAGTGILTVTVPYGYIGTGFYSEVVFYDENTNNFKNATNITTSVITTK
ncbi:MAG: S8 family serine peptidase [Planctomycetota bacterium]